MKTFDILGAYKFLLQPCGTNIENSVKSRTQYNYTSYGTERFLDVFNGIREPDSERNWDHLWLVSAYSIIHTDSA